VAIEDAGFDVRDSIAWLYGSGFPKSLDIAKAIQKSSGVEALEAIENKNGRFYGEGYNPTPRRLIMPELEGEAKKWQGWGTALKPAFEPVVVARKPLVGTVAANVLLWGVGRLNIDGSRIGTETISVHNAPTGSFAGGDADRGSDTSSYKTHTGRWPANIILDEYTAGLLDEQSGESVSKPFVGDGKKHLSRSMSGGAKSFSGSTHNDSGGASRFFYVAKASKKDRNEGLDNIEGQQIGAKGNGLGRTCATCGATVLDGCQCPDRTFVNPTRQNFHPTVKPTALMEYLVKLVTPPGGTVLDPFTGSGSTGKAALLNGFKFIGIELTADYLPIIEGRLKHAAETYAAKATEEETKEQETLF
jgi:site-specific DNA-methyltransferase (adenine-specific)